MNVVCHVITNAGRWKGPSTLSQIDATLFRMHSLPIHVDWTDLEMIDDDHFTTRGAVDFAHRLVTSVLTALPRPLTQRLHVITDSTIDYNDWDDTNHHHHKQASNYLIALFESSGFSQVTVDAVGGSGFVSYPHFRPRLKAHFASTTPLPVANCITTNSTPTTILFMGGWNDLYSGHPLPRILRAVQECVDIARHGTSQRSCQAV